MLCLHKQRHITKGKRQKTKTKNKQQFNSLAAKDADMSLVVVKTHC